MDQHEATSVLSGLWESFQRMDIYWSRLVVGALLIVVGLTVEFWKFMLPFWGFCILVVGYLRFSRSKDSL